MTYDELVARAATVGIELQDDCKMHWAERNGVLVHTFGLCDYSNGVLQFLLGVSAALDAVEAMQAERKPAGEMPKGGAA